jgi:hypothetical protein
MYPKFKTGAVAAYQHAVMIRSHYRIADTIDECLEKLGAGNCRPNKVKASRRASFEVNKNISKALRQIGAPYNNENMPAIITAALNERLAETDSVSSCMSESSYDLLKEQLS